MFTEEKHFLFKEKQKAHEMLKSSSEDCRRWSSLRRTLDDVLVALRKLVIQQWKEEKPRQTPSLGGKVRKQADGA